MPTITSPDLLGPRTGHHEPVDRWVRSHQASLARANKAQDQQAITRERDALTAGVALRALLAAMRLIDARTLPHVVDAAKLAPHLSDEQSAALTALLRTAGAGAGADAAQNAGTGTA